MPIADNGDHRSTAQGDKPVRAWEERPERKTGQPVPAAAESGEKQLKAFPGTAAVLRAARPFFARFFKNA